MNEIWRDIKGYEGYYLVSNFGRVRSLRKNIILKPQIRRSKYYRVNLCVNNSYKHMSIHRLVALAFIPNPDNLPAVNHKDENKLNNNVNNLEWCTFSYNNTYNNKVEKTKATYIQNNSKKIICLETNKIYDAQCYAAEEFAEKLNKSKEATQSAINKCLRHLNATAYGYHFEYLED